MPKLAPLLITVALALTALAACSNTKPSESTWAANVVKICTTLEADRQSAAKALPSDAPPSVEQLMAFFKVFAPTFAAANQKMKAVERPEGLGAEINAFEAAMDAESKAMKTASNDRAAAQKELDSDGQGPSTVRLESASTKAGLEKCNG